MNRKEVYQEIEHVMGLVPTMFRSLPDSSLELEWQLFKKTQIEDSAIPNKYRELIGLGIAAAMKCKYCAYFHTEVARLFGATDAEIEDAVHFAKAVSGWSTYVNGLQIDFDQFKAEINESCAYIRRTQLQEAY
ncbi:MAG: carboxymuconolactone decarboxylase family protein [Bacteroidota bacterium]|nr:carboxymuconolactone decarboxylase family protein [Bacteroidota bacterium]